MRRAATNLFLSSSSRSSCSCHLSNILSIESSSSIKSSRSTTQHQQLLVGSTSTRQLSSRHHHNSRIYRPEITAITSSYYTSSSMSTGTNNTPTSTDVNGTTTTSRPPSTNMVVPDGHELITEGTITMLYPKSENSVFYNPVQVQNRDLSVLMIGMFAERRMEKMWITKKRKELRKKMNNQLRDNEGNKEEVKKETKEERKARLAKFEQDLEAQVALEKSTVNFTKLTQESSSSQTITSKDDNNNHNLDGMTIFEALAASGLRSLRYWKEVPGIRSIVVNDLDPVAVDLARENVVRNGLANELVNDRVDSTKANGDATAGGEDANSTTTSRHVRPRGIQLQVGDATHEMYMSRLQPNLHLDQCNSIQLHYQKPQYDVIDLDPYGSSAPFMDAAMQSVASGGLLAVTCTDMAALGGSHPETCYGRYGAFPVQRSGYLQELALRILLYHMSVVAARYGRTIRPVLSVGMAFYCRVFVEVYDDKAGVNNLSLNHGHLFQSIRCSSFHITPVATNEFVSTQQQQQNNNAEKEQHTDVNKKSNVYRNGRGPCALGEPVCGETGGPYKIGGPLWIGPLHDMDVVNDAIQRLETAKLHGGVHPSGGSPTHPLHTNTTLHGLLVAVSEELPDVPLYHLLPYLCSAVNSSTIPMTSFKAAIVNAGYRVSAYHKEPHAIKTDAPNHVVWDVVRAWCKEHPPQKKKESKKHREGNEQGSSGNVQMDRMHADIASKILSNEIRTEVDFTIPDGFGTDRKKAKRWAMNPEPNWGPKKAASGRNKRKHDDVGEEDV